MSVPKLQVRQVRLIRFTMLDSLGVCRHLWIYERSQSQIQLTESDRDPPTLIFTHVKFIITPDWGYAARVTYRQAGSRQGQGHYFYSKRTRL